MAPLEVEEENELKKKYKVRLTSTKDLIIVNITCGSGERHEEEGYQRSLSLRRFIHSLARSRLPFTLRLLLWLPRGRPLSRLPLPRRRASGRRIIGRESAAASLIEAEMSVFAATGNFQNGMIRPYSRWARGRRHRP